MQLIVGYLERKLLTERMVREGSQCHIFIWHAYAMAKFKRSVLCP